LNSADQVIGLPKSWVRGTDKNITIVAKAYSNGFPENPDNADNQARDMLYVMLQTLLIDRYKMNFHYEDRLVDAPTLTASKPKLTKADPSGRTGCKRLDQQQQGLATIVKLACTSMSMAQFAEQMQALDPGILYPVHDETGIDGAWDFIVTYDLRANFRPMRPGPATAQSNSAVAQPEDPSGSLSHFSMLFRSGSD
jgi:uncharacterized protein (TIGR03435 family)